jgi:hypothetical protein
MGIHWGDPLNINLNINNENQDVKICTVCVGGISGEGVKEGDLRWWYTVDGLHIPIWNRTKKPLAIALSEGERRCGNVKYKSNQNYYYKSPPI